MKLPKTIYHTAGLFLRQRKHPNFFQIVSLSSTMASASTKSHYENHSADSYENAYFYEVGAYTEHLRDLVQEYLQFKAANKRKVILDIGGGTGSFTRMILKGTNMHAIVIDPFLEKSVSVDDKDAVVRFISAPAESFMEQHDVEHDWKTGYHQILMKEVAHHFADADRIPIFKGMFQGLLPSDGPPSILIITRPQKDIDYPLWDEARLVWEQNQPSLDQFISELESAGFMDVKHSIEEYPCTVALDRWQSMVKRRFWSTFSHFSDDALEAACEKIAENERHRLKNGILHFEDRLLFITAKKL